MNNGTKIGSVVRASILLSILIALSGMAAMVTAGPGMDPLPNWFLGDVTLNGAPAPAGTVINAFIDGDLRGSTVVESPGEYEYLRVEGSTLDNGKNITFTVCGVNAEPNGTWIVRTNQGAQILDLSAGDYEKPVVTGPDANPPSIVPENGVQLSRLNVTVTDNSAVGTVTVNLSAIGGPEAKVMEYFGGDLYSTTTTAANGTPYGTYHLWVNASDVVANYNDSVYITLNVTPMTSDDWRYEYMGPGSEGDPWTDVTTAELVDAAYHWINDIPVRDHILTPADIQELVAAWLASGGDND